MSIEIKDINGVVNCLKSNYITRLSTMSFLMGVKDIGDEYYIYQEISGLPIKRFVCSPADRTFSIAASWHSREHWYSLVRDANDEEIEAWKELLDRSRPFNSRLNKDGLTRKDWMIIEKAIFNPYRKSNKKYKLPKTDKFDTFIEMRIPFVNKVNFYEWGFEFVSNKMIMAGMIHKNLFPYAIKSSTSGKVFNTYFDDDDDDDGLYSIPRLEENNIPETRETENIDIKDIYKYDGNKSDSNKLNRMINVSWVGDRIIFKDINDNINDNSDLYRVKSFWHFSPCYKDDIDKEIEDVILFGKKQDEDQNILDVGQRKFDKLDLD